MLFVSGPNGTLDIAESNQVVALRRPNDLASDTATTVDAVIHAVDEVDFKIARCLHDDFFCKLDHVLFVSDPNSTLMLLSYF